MNEYQIVDKLLSSSINVLEAFNEELKAITYKEYKFFINWCEGQCIHGWKGPSKNAVKIWQNNDGKGSLCSLCKSVGVQD